MFQPLIFRGVTWVFPVEVGCLSHYFLRFYLTYIYIFPNGWSYFSEVLIYFWDERDGPELCGWWFGPKARVRTQAEQATSHDRPGPPGFGKGNPLISGK